MAKAKRRLNKKRIALAAVILAVILAAVIAAVVLLAGGSGRVSFRDISTVDPAPEPVFEVVNGPAETPSPFPRYTVTAPEEYTQTDDSSLTANRFTQEYLDTFYTQDGHYLSVTQRPVRNGDRVSLTAGAEYEIVEFAGMEVLYHRAVRYDGQELVGLTWIKDNTRFSLTSNQLLERDEALQWITWVDLENPSVPETRPLEILPGQVWTFPGETGEITVSRPWQVVGNPDLPSQRQTHSFSAPPQGFSGGSSGYSNGFETWVYENEAGDMLYLTNPTISSYSCTLFSLTDEELADPDAVQQVTVGGCSGVMHLGEEESTLVWLVEDGYVELGYRGEITAEQLLALGEQVN